MTFSTSAAITLCGGMKSWFWKTRSKSRSDIKKICWTSISSTAAVLMFGFSDVLAEFEQTSRRPP